MKHHELQRHVYSDLESRRAANDFDYERQETYSISRLHRLMRAAVLEAFEPFGVAFAEFAVMGIVRSVQPVTNAELARLTKVSPQATSRLVATLTKSGVFQRLDGPGALQPIVLTEAGVKLHNDLLEVERNVIVRLASSDDEWRKLLEAVVDQASKLLDG